MSREVGGTELPSILRALAASLRQEAAVRSEVEARQSWVLNAARLGVAAPWIVLLLLASRAEAAAAYNSPAGRDAARRRIRGHGRRLPAHDRARPPARGTAVVRVTTATALADPARDRASGSGSGRCSPSCRASARRGSRAGSRRTSSTSPPRPVPLSTAGRPSPPRSSRARRRPAVAHVARALTAVLGGDDGIARRLRQAGSAGDVRGVPIAAAAVRDRRDRRPASSIAVVLAHASAASGLLLAGVVRARRRRRPDRAGTAARPRRAGAAGAHRDRAADRARVPHPVALRRREHPRRAPPRRAHRNRRTRPRVRSRGRRRQRRDGRCPPPCRGARRRSACPP